MKQLFLTEVLTSVITPAAYTRTTPVLIQSQNTITLFTNTYIAFAQGMYISINSGPRYPVQSITFDSLSLTYVVAVLGGIQPMPKTTLSWSIFNSNVTVNSVELDTTDTDITTVFSVSELADISVRKDNITKNIVLKGTETNNRAFGHLFMLNRNVSLTLINRLFFNYAPIRTVDCLLYDNSVPILRGSLMITAINIDSKGTVFYQATITGNFISLKNRIGDKLMTNLMLNDMEHTYSALAVVDSWGAKTGGADTVGNSRTYWTDLVTGIEYTKPFAFGTGYVYPMIDYGERFQSPEGNNTAGFFKLQNFRPAPYAMEYLRRIMSDAGFTFEVQGSAEFIARLNKIIIPDNYGSLKSVQTVTSGQFNATGYKMLDGEASPPDYIWFNMLESYDGTSTGTPGEPGLFAMPIQFATNTISTNLNFDNQLFPNVDLYMGGPLSVPAANRQQVLLRVKKTMRSGARVQANGTIQVRTGAAQTYYVQLYRRKRLPDGQVDTLDSVRAFDLLGEEGFQGGPGTVAWAVDFDVPEMDYFAGDQLMLAVSYFKSDFDNRIDLIAASVRVPGRAGDVYTAEPMPGDKIMPRAPIGIKQMDFLKSFISLNNMYLYSTKDRPTHLYFATYDDYYALTSPILAPSAALNWSTKLDLSKGLIMKSNLNIPKNYLFTYKADNDYLNSLYNGKYNRVYGDFRFTDSLGLVAEKKVELIFSPTPPAMITGLSRMIPLISQGGIDARNKNPMQTNLRVLYYSGTYFDKVPANVCVDSWAPSGIPVWTVASVFSVEWYPLSGNYLFDSYNDIFHPANSRTQPLVPVLDIHFGPPNEYYFDPTDNYLTIDTHYKYYIAQTSELTSANLITIDAMATLTEIDINNLDLKVPIFVSLDGAGYAYFKVLQVTYSDSKTLSSITLQKLNL